MYQTITPHTVAPAYPECLYTKAHKWNVDWCIVYGDERYPQRRVFNDKASAIEFVHSHGHNVTVID